MNSSAQKTQVYIDGQAGTTGLQITERLATREDLTLTFLDDAQRKDPQARKRALQEADVAILCLPDDAAREAVALADGQTRLIDASTAHRTDAKWVYGLPELDPDYRAQLATAQYVSNPGCYPQGVILSIRPLVQSGIVQADLALRVHAVSGYSGGGRQMVEDHQQWSAAQADALNSQTYALTLSHKHVPEMQTYALLEQAPIFTPTVAHYYKGMLVHIPLFASEVSGGEPAVLECLQDRYAEDQFIEVIDGADLPAGSFLNPTACNDTNKLELFVFGNDQQLLLIARYDNLGKGASGAAVQNLNLMLGLEESCGL